MVEQTPLVECCAEKLVIFFDRNASINFMELQVDPKPSANENDSTTEDNVLSHSSSISAVPTLTTITPNNSNNNRTVPAAGTQSGFDRLKKVVRMFLQIKKLISAGRENQSYCILVEDENCEIVAIPAKGLVEADVALNALQKLQCETVETYGNGDCALNLDDILAKSFEIAEPFPPPPNDSSVISAPPYVTRLLLVISRSSGNVTFNLNKELTKELSNPYLFIDTLYIHEHPNKDNHVQEIYKTLCSLNVNNLGYILECGPCTVTWHDSMSRLLAHPLIRRKLGGTNGLENGELLSTTAPTTITTMDSIGCDTVVTSNNNSNKLKSQSTSVVEASCSSSHVARDGKKTFAKNVTGQKAAVADTVDQFISRASSNLFNSPGKT